MKIRFLILLLTCFLSLNSFYCCASSLVFDLSGLPAVSSIWNGEAVTEVFIPESEGGGPGGCVAIIAEETPVDLSYQYYYNVAEDVVKVELVTHLLDEDQISCAQVVDAKIGDTFIGFSGTIYALQKQDILSEAQLQYLAHKDIVIVGEWVPTSNIDNIGVSTLGPFYAVEEEVTYEYYIGYAPPSPPTDEVPTPGGWIVTKLDPFD